MAEDARQDYTGASGESRVEEWRPTLGISVLWTVLAVFLTVSSFVAFLALDRWLPDTGGFDSFPGVTVDAPGEGSVTLSMDLGGILLLMLAAVGVLLAHEAIHGAAFRYFGGRPEYGAAIHNRLLIVLYCSAPGYSFTRGQMSVILLAPVVALTALGTGAMAITNLGFWLIVPMAVNFGGSIGDFWMAGMLTRRPSETLIEDQKDGLNFYYPDPVHEPG